MKPSRNNHPKVLLWVVVGVTVCNLSDCSSDTEAKTLAELGQLANRFASFEENFGDPGSPGTWANFISAQAGHTDLNALIPSIYLPRFTPSLRFSKMIVCQRSKVSECMYKGNSSNGLPERLQGVWWQDGVGFPEQAISTAGHWDNERRVLTINSGNDRAWAAWATSSVKDPSGLFWLPAGASHMNIQLLTRPTLEIYFNEDITFGQINLGFDVAFVRIFLPPSLVNFTMEWQPEDGSWRRRTQTLGINDKTGNYVLRRIVDGKGKPGLGYDGWLKFRGGEPFIVTEQVFP